MIIGVLFPDIEDLTNWVIGLEKSGLKRANWPNPKFVDYLNSSTLVDDRNKAFAYMQDPANMSDAIKERF